MFSFLPRGLFARGAREFMQKSSFAPLRMILVLWSSHYVLNHTKAGGPVKWFATEEEAFTVRDASCPQSHLYPGLVCIFGASLFRRQKYEKRQRITCLLGEHPSNLILLHQCAKLVCNYVCIYGCIYGWMDGCTGM